MHSTFPLSVCVCVCVCQNFSLQSIEQMFSLALSLSFSLSLFMSTFAKFYSLSHLIPSKIRLWYNKTGTRKANVTLIDTRKAAASWPLISSLQVSKETKAQAWGTTYISDLSICYSLSLALCIARFSFANPICPVVCKSLTHSFTCSLVEN